MSAKCKYSKKFEPLVTRWRNRYKEDKDAFISTFSEYFTDGNDTAEELWVGGNTSSNPKDPSGYTTWFFLNKY